MTWHDIENANDPELDRLAREHSLHPLHIEDCRHRNQRGKVEEGGSYEFIVLKPVELCNGSELTFDDLDLFIGPDWLITVREGDPEASGRLLRPIQAAASGLTTGQILYRIFDATVDSYLRVTDRLDDVIDELEESVLTNPEPAILSRIFGTRKQLIELRRVLANTRDVAAHLYRTEHSQIIPPDLVPFLRDVYDHVSRCLDLVETQRDLLAGVMDVYLSTVANRTNNVMKVLTVLGTIALPALVISGFFGMNLKGLPFAEASWGTEAITGLMAATTLLLLLILRWLKWL